MSASELTLSPALLRDIIGWDVQNWQTAIELWEARLPRRLAGWRGLELGAGRGGLSLYLGLKGASMLCSDHAVPTATARSLHAQYGLQPEYLALDACAPLPFAAASLDLVCFKSVLGGLRKGRSTDPKPGLIAEIERVLRPGGWLLLAENLQGMWLHRQLRRRFVIWSKGWEYLGLDDLLKLLAGFELDYRTTGLLALLGRNEAQRRCLGQIDRQLAPYLPSDWHYMCAVAAQKPPVQSLAPEYIASS
ncbi:MAG: hypothetical protein CVV27_17760 [Candidatus Melainabacteria bacterium HGW-Melainabacteria-1]|nr:MAG: hypothetical protein CVV27_17760 [Candidatus Melainabacteria bacterium HGW-Melainabacteria-1]